MELLLSLLLYKHLWIPAIVIGVNCVFLSTYFGIRCSDPRPILEKVVDAGNFKYYDELEAVNSIYEKLFKSKHCSTGEEND